MKKHNIQIVKGNKYWIEFGAEIRQAKVIYFDGVAVEYKMAFRGRYTFFAMKMTNCEKKEDFINRIIN